LAGLICVTSDTARSDSSWLILVLSVAACSVAVVLEEPFAGVFPFDALER
jgi:hypothetical protein